MATSSDRGGGPGSYTSKGVKCTMDPPFTSGLSKGSQENLSGTFDHPRTGGDNGLPTTVKADFGNSTKTPKAGFAAAAPSKDLDGMKTY